MKHIAIVAPYRGDDVSLAAVTLAGYFEHGRHRISYVTTDAVTAKGYSHNFDANVMSTQDYALGRIRSMVNDALTVYWFAPSANLVPVFARNAKHYFVAGTEIPRMKEADFCMETCNALLLHDSKVKDVAAVMLGTVLLPVPAYAGLPVLSYKSTGARRTVVLPLFADATGRTVYNALHVCDKLAKEYPDTFFHVLHIGSALRKNVPERYLPSQKNKRVVYFASTSDAALQEAVKRSARVIDINTSGRFGVVSLMAQAWGVPTVAVNDELHRDVIQHGIDGHLVDIDVASPDMRIVNDAAKRVIPFLHKAYDGLCNSMEFKRNMELKQREFVQLMHLTSQDKLHRSHYFM